MKLLKKICVLFGALFVGLSWQNPVTLNASTKVEAAEVGSYATLLSGGSVQKDTDGTEMILAISNSGLFEVKKNSHFDHINSSTLNIVNLVITNKSEYVKPGYSVGPIDVGSNSSQLTDGCNVAAYFYSLDENAATYDAIFYANVEKIYAPENCVKLFSGLYETEGTIWSALETITFDNIDTSKVTDMQAMFYISARLTKINGLENFNTSNVTNFGEMFAYTKSLKSINLTSFDTSNAMTFASMFQGCGAEKLDLSNFTNQDMAWFIYMFNECTDLQELDISGLTITNVGGDEPTTMGYYIFLAKLDNLKVLYLPKLGKGTHVVFPKQFGDGSTLHLYGPTTEDDPKVLISTTDTYPYLDNPESTWNLQTFVNEIMKSNTCTDYVNVSKYRAMYNQLSDSDKAIFDRMKDYDDNVLVLNKLLYMEYLMEANDVPTELKSHYVLSLETSQYLVVGIVGFSLMIVSAYYVIQKKKYARQ